MEEVALGVRIMLYSALNCRPIRRNLQRHHAVSLRQYGFLVLFGGKCLYRPIHTETNIYTYNVLLLISDNIKSPLFQSCISSINLNNQSQHTCRVPQVLFRMFCSEIVWR